MKYNRAFKEMIQAFLHLLRHKAYQDLSILEIVEESTYSRSSFYTYFSNKDELLDSCRDYYASLYATALHNAMQEYIVEENDTFSFAKATLSFVYEERLFFDLLIAKKLGYEDIDGFCTAVEKAFREISFADTSAKANDVSLSLQDDEDFFYFVQTRHFFSYILYWHRHAFAIPLEEMARKMQAYLGGSREV